MRYALVGAAISYECVTHIVLFNANFADNLLFVRIQFNPLDEIVFVNVVDVDAPVRVSEHKKWPFETIPAKLMFDLLNQ